MRYFLVLCALLVGPVATAETITFESVRVRPGTALERPATEVDPVERARIAGDDLLALEGSPWRELRADDEGWIVDDALIHGYAYAEIEVDDDSTWLLDAMGYAGVIVNGEPRVGNVYGYTDTWESWEPHFDFSLLPVHLRRGINRFLFHGSRYGLLRARLERIESGLSFNPRDTTLPDLVAGESYEGWGSIVVVNATDEVVMDAEIAATIDGGEVVRSKVASLPPFGVRKVGFALRGDVSPNASAAAVTLTLERDGRPHDRSEVVLAVKGAHENRRVTFRSAIDGSVQYFGYLPASGEPGPKALFLSLHGASVEAINQSGSYPALSWGHLVAPTNRRPFGFSWEDWGRRDALEVLDLALDRLDVDESRVYLTGHSMGGHGSWHLSTLLPDRFAAVGPSAGWISVWSYRQDPPSTEPDALTALVEQGTLPSQTLEFAPNLAGLGVYVLHGAADDNVPPEQAHLMLDRLDEFHEDFVYHEEPGVGHWWDRHEDAGADCVSWPPMFDFFARHRRASAEEVRNVDFRTPSPAISAWRLWAGVITQQRSFATSRVTLDRDAGWTRVDGTTENVEVLALDWSRAAGDSVRIMLDGQHLVAAIPADGTVWLRRGDAWSVTDRPDPRHKGSSNHGGFRSAFEHRVQLVYGTQGTADENAWARAKARFDAEWLWYQGNASVDVLPDTMFDPAAEPDRSVVLYGHAQMHEDWDALVDDLVRVERGALRVGARRFEGQGAGALVVRPRPGSAFASVGIVAATGPAGCRLMDRRPYLSLGVAYPDVTVFESTGAAAVVRAAGFFGNDWSVEHGEFVFADPTVDDAPRR